jgi:hypothetical protein
MVENYFQKHNRKYSTFSINTITITATVELVT